MMVMIFYGDEHLNVRHRNFAPCIIGSDLSCLQNGALREHDCDRANNEKVRFDVGVGGGDDVEVDGGGDGEIGGACDRRDDDFGDNILSGCQLIISAGLVSS